MAAVRKFGTFGGVFVPSILTILGVIMYLRLPMIVGEAGLWQTIGIILIAHIISVTTGLSVSSIATDKRVQAGGTYYMISRSLGLPIGGTLGLALFVGLSFSVSLYLIGFAESFLSFLNFDKSINSIRIAGSITLVLVTVVTFISTSLAIKTQYFIMAAIALSLVSVLFGQHEFAPSLQTSTQVGTAVPFMVLFGIFFPAVTGFEAGVSMSGDLKDPKKSIPFGSISAIVVGLVVYLGLAFFFFFSVDRNLLANDPDVLLKISWVPVLVVIGIWGATLSSALGSILGAPRILQATASDNITHRFFARGTGKTNEPRNALLLTFALAEAGILIGELDVIARIVSIFFITTYCFLNISCTIESLTSADFRPTFRTPFWVSLLGAVACLIVMIELDFVAALAATVLLVGLYLFLKRKELTLQSGDTWAGVWSSLVKASLSRLTSMQQHSRNWRPNILMFNGADKARPFMLELGSAITGKLGLLSSFEFKVTQQAQPNRAKRIMEVSDTREGLNFHYIYECEDVYNGIDQIARMYGFPGVEPNTLLMGWSRKPENKGHLLSLMRALLDYDYNSLFLHHDNVGKKLKHPTIDIWWSGWGRNLSLALNIIRHLLITDSWSRSSIRVLILVSADEDTERVYQSLRAILHEYRIQAEIRVLQGTIGQSPEQIIGSESSARDLTIVGIPDSRYDDLEATYEYVTHICQQLKTALFINASSGLEEHTVLGSAVSTLKEKGEWVLPDLEESTYAAINVDLIRIDERALTIATQMHKRVFSPALALHLKLLDGIKKTVNHTQATLTNVPTYGEVFHRKDTLAKARTYFNYQIESQVQLFRDEIKATEETIAEGVNWYLDLIEKDIDRFPIEKVVSYPRGEFKHTRTDAPHIRWNKMKKRWLHPFSRKSISLRLKYRSGASYFFKDSRYHFISLLLPDFIRRLTELTNGMIKFVVWSDERFSRLFSAVDDERVETELETFATQLTERSAALDAHLHELNTLFLGRLQLESRKNVNLFKRHLERIDFNEYTSRRSQLRRIFSARRREIEEFPSLWYDTSVLDADSLRAKMALTGFCNLSESVLIILEKKLAKFFDDELLKPHAELLAAMQATESGSRDKVQQLVIQWAIDYDKLNEAISGASEEIINKTSSIPDEVTLRTQLSQGETEEIPLRAVVAHVIETQLTGPLADRVDEAIEKIRKVYLIISDNASFALFSSMNLSNIHEQALVEAELRKCMARVKSQEDVIKHIRDSLAEAVAHERSAIRSHLSLNHLEEVAAGFDQLVRTRRAQKFKTRVGRRLHQISQWTKNLFVNLLYSQARGVLLARKLTGKSIGDSGSELLRQAIHQLTPRREILQQLPHYYASLFSGRSSIGSNFWIQRTAEEKGLQDAYHALSNGKEGIVLMLGERNSGKTALCHRFTESLPGDHSRFHLYPPADGSAEVSDFETALRKATRLHGSTTDIMNLLPSKSVLVIHDLELWWERSTPDGLSVIRHIKEMSALAGGKCMIIINMNPFAYEVINTAENLDDYCFSIIRCRPFDSYELKQMLSTRHRSSNVGFHFENKNEFNAIGEVAWAKIFNKLFEFSGGNPGVAMNLWLTGIEKFEHNAIHWRIPDRPDPHAWDHLLPAWDHICLQLLLHKRMTIDKMVRCIRMDASQIRETVGVLKRSGLIVVRSDSSYQIHPAIEFMLIKHLRKREMI